jgi:peroxiredoxin Q/BCP
MKKFALFVGAVAIALGTANVGAQAPVELKVGDTAPAFSLPGTDGKTHTLAEHKGKFVVVAWYPKAMTSGCTRECRAIRDSSEVLKGFNVAYYMASVDTPELNKQFADLEQVNFPFLSDPSKTVATAYGVLPPGGGFANRWTFYIGPDGKIAYIDKAVNADGVDKAGANLAARLEALGAKKK